MDTYAYSNQCEHNCKHMLCINQKHDVAIKSMPTVWNSLKKRHVHPNVHRSTVYNSQDMEAT